MSKSSGGGVLLDTDRHQATRDGSMDDKVTHPQYGSAASLDRADSPSVNSHFLASHSPEANLAEAPVAAEWKYLTASTPFIRRAARHSGSTITVSALSTNARADNTTIGGQATDSAVAPVPPSQAEVILLREELLAARAQVAHLNGELAQSRSTENSPSNADAGVGASTEEPPQHRFFGGVRNMANVRGSPPDWSKSNPNLLEGSIPDSSVPQNSPPNRVFAPGVIGQSPVAMSSAGLPGLGHNTRVTNHGVHQSDVRTEGRPGDLDTRYINVWGPSGQFIALGTADSSRAITPATAFSTPASPHHFSGLSQFPSPVGSRYNYSSLSPTAAEFTGPGQLSEARGPAPWNHQAHSMTREGSQQSYMINTDPPNYRRLLERHMSCNWKYVVDKIVCNNDQQASIFLQQKLKVGTSEQKYEIIQAILAQAYPLMVNRFGNFLIQRCFEHGNPDQVVAIARAIRGNTLNLSMDAFGCHVVQKAFDCAPEEYKAIMVHELLRRIPETVIHRYACHVWQKLFELRWNGSPPQIMKHVNYELRGMWHEVALGETGSLVVQNIFENCLEDDKRPCVDEVLASIDVIAHGQFGNWCIQHICEHGSIPDRTRATDHVLRFATEYSMDQFASKVVEKCLKIGGTDFLDKYLDRVCKARPDRPRMPLIDIAGDQFGNYLIQHILGSADSHRREIVASHVRRHMVSLRGSKYGSRVALLCTNPASATRPGPGSGHAGVLDRAPGGTSRTYSDRGQWPSGRPVYDRGF